MSESETPNRPRSSYTRLKESQAARKSGESKAQRAKRFAPKGKPAADDAVPYHLHGLHAVRAALGNPQRKVYKVLATPNALQRLEMDLDPKLKVQTVTPRDLDALLGADSVHQGIAVLIEPLPA